MTFVAVALAALVPAAAAPRAQLAAAPLHHRAAGHGTVVDVTSRRAYLDAGTRDGLAVGMVIELRRGERPATTCRIEIAAEWQAVCDGEGIKAGDTFRLPSAPAAEEAKPLPAPLASAELTRRASAVAQAPQELVDFQARPAPPPPVWHGAEAFLGYANWSSAGSGPLQQERLDVSLRDYAIGAGWKLDLDLEALHWSTGTAAPFRPDDRNQLYVWQAALATRDPGQRYTLALGRVLPWSAPGATLFDGVQAGFRPTAATEVGLYGGGIPDIETTAPSFDRHTVGAYWSIDGGGAGALLRHQGRLAWVHLPELGGDRLEAELVGQAYLGSRLQASGDVRLGFGKAAAWNDLDALRLDAFTRPVERVNASLSFRYLGLTSPEYAGPADLPAGGPSRQVDGAVGVDATRALTVSIVGGWSHDILTGLEREWLGPEVSLPRLLGQRGGMSAGWLEERGWLGGRTIYLQVVARPFDPLRLLARLSYFDDVRSGGPDDQALGGFLSADADLTRWLSFRLSLLARGGIGSGVDRTTTAFGLTALAGLAGRY
ncbi:MAG TPA: hypothetical protein VLU43_17360 [Anaeromyxobacteraceae bacterium]|nr:hypothetical protein [Anaeromyxobacteraceae bacterium]